MVHENLRPSDIMTKAAFENAVVAAAALGASSNCPIHMVAIARHMGVEHSAGRLAAPRSRHPAAGRCAAGRAVPGREIPPRRRRARGAEGTAGGRQAARRRDDRDRARRWPRTWPTCPTADREVIRAYAEPLKPAAGYVVMSGNLFDSAVMKISVIDQDFRARFLSDPAHPERVRRQGDRVRGAGGLPRTASRTPSSAWKTSRC